MSNRADKLRNKSYPRESQDTVGVQALVAPVSSKQPAKSARASRKKAAASADRTVAPQSAKIKFGREVCGNLDAAEARRRRKALRTSASAPTGGRSELPCGQSFYGSRVIRTKFSSREVRSFRTLSLA